MSGGGAVGNGVTLSYSVQIFLSRAEQALRPTYDPVSVI
jgi:hypothetical protein